MGNKNKRTARRAATLLAMLGALVMSSGIALTVTATSANAAAQKVTFCHSTESESNPWVKVTASVNAFYVGHVLKQHTSDVYPAVSFQKQGETINVPAQGDQSLLENNCNSEDEPGDVLIAVDVEFTDPTCLNQNTASYVVTGDNEDVTVEESAAPAPGATVTVTATAKEGFSFDEGDTYSEEHTFAAAEADCGGGSVIVSPPGGGGTKADPPAAETVTPTVVSAGLTDVASDMRGEQGLALVFAGMLMLVGAGGLGLRLRGGSRI